ncbi:MAG: hypothetical protein KDA57_18085 [Planctomycetales bacterium]|nr:hypothetical protein [Planctomycetales bacterium]
MHVKVARDGDLRIVRYGNEILRYRAGREVSANLDLSGYVIAGSMPLRTAAMLSKGITELRKGDLKGVNA